MFILDWLRTGVSWVLVQFYDVLSNFIDPTSGWTWALSIVGLVIVIRIALIPLFVKQIKAQRNLQIIQPQMKEIQKKYAGDKERQSQEMMKLYKETGTNPLASCLPILLQAPIFFALFSVLQGIAMLRPEGVFNWDRYAPLLQVAHDASIFGVPLYGTFLGADEVALDGFNPTSTRVLTFYLDHFDELDHVFNPTSVDCEKYSSWESNGAPTKDLVVRVSDRVRGRWRQLPDRCIDLLVHHKRVDHGTTVLGYSQ